jgi:Cys-tRNA(Pro) deacylase
MAKSIKVPVTQAVRALRDAGISFTPHLYRYEERGGTAASSRELGVEEHQVIKTLIMEDDTGAPLVILMHGDREVATGRLAKAIGAKKVKPCTPQVADKHSGYQVGGTSPFGLKTAMPIYAQSTIQELETIYINGGKRGFLVEISVEDLVAVAAPVWVDVQDA